MTTAIILILVIVGITIFIVNFFTFSSMIVSLISIAIIVTDPIILEYNKYKERKRSYIGEHLIVPAIFVNKWPNQQR